MSNQSAVALFGYDQGLFSGVVLCQDYLDVLGIGGDANTNLRSIITSIYAIGCFAGGELIREGGGGIELRKGC